jgi:hypothetical protein
MSPGPETLSVLSRQSNIAPNIRTCIKFVLDRIVPRVAVVVSPFVADENAVGRTCKMQPREERHTRARARAPPPVRVGHWLDVGYVAQQETTVHFGRLRMQIVQLDVNSRCVYEVSISSRDLMVVMDVLFRSGNCIGSPLNECFVL